MSETEFADAIRATGERLEALKAAVQKKRLKQTRPKVHDEN